MDKEDTIYVVDEDNVAANVLVSSEPEPLKFHLQNKQVFIIRKKKTKPVVTFQEPSAEVLAALEGHLESHHFKHVVVKKENTYEEENDEDYPTQQIIIEPEITKLEPKEEFVYEAIEMELDADGTNNLTEEIVEYVVADDFGNEAVNFVNETVDFENETVEYVSETVEYENEVVEDNTSHLALEHDYDDPDIKYMEFFCGVCGKSFTTEKAVSMHMSRMHMKRPVGQTNPRRNKSAVQGPKPKKAVCEVCGKKYASNAALRYHQRVHTGEKPYMCTACNKRFTMPLFLQIHARIHTGERPYVCQLCPKAFSNRAALLRHDRVHTGAKPYPCLECGKTFTQSNSMKLHVRTVHRKLPAPYKSRARKLKEMLRQKRLQEAQEETAVMFAVREMTEDDVGTADHEEMLQQGPKIVRKQRKRPRIIQQPQNVARLIKVEETASYEEDSATLIRPTTVYTTGTRIIYKQDYSDEDS